MTEPSTPSFLYELRVFLHEPNDLVHDFGRTAVHSVEVTEQTAEGLSITILCGPVRRDSTPSPHPQRNSNHQPQDEKPTDARTDTNPYLASLERPEDEPEGTLDGPFDDTSTLVSLALGSAVAANDELEASAAACEPERRTRTTGAWKVSPLVPVPWVVMRVPPTAMVVVPRGLNV
jgi:hypothetical protein